MKITRLSISPYQNTDFLEKEKAALSDFEKNGLLGEILITNTLTNISAIDPDQIKLIIHPNSGYDNFPVDFVQKANFPIVIGNEIRAQAVCEYILFCLFKRFGEFPNQNIWDRKLRNRFLLKEKNILIIGQGHIGKLLRTTLQGLVKKIFAVDPFVEEAAKSLDEVPLKNCDVVILCASLNPTSYHLVNQDFLEKLPTNFTLINPARGDLINQEDLLKYLKLNPSSFAFLDVFKEEPNEMDFSANTNLFTTSHIAGVFENLDDNIIDFERRVLHDFIHRPLEFSQIYKNSILKNRIKDNFLV
jgi:D-3-phosphoglycerate dehydrogenase / 2-oxoglutarate reductase